MALGGSAAAAPMVSSSSSGGAGRPVSAGASVPLRRGCCCCCPFYSRGCDLNLYLSVSSLQTPPRSRHRLPCPAGRAEGAEAGGGAAAAAAPQLGAPGSALPARCAAPGAVRAGGGVTWPPSRCPRRRPRSAAPRPGPARPRRRPAAPPEQVRAAGTRSSSRGGRAAWRGGECYLSMAFYAQIGFLNFYFTRKGGNECLSQLPFPFFLSSLYKFGFFFSLPLLLPLDRHAEGPPWAMLVLPPSVRIKALQLLSGAFAKIPSPPSTDNTSNRKWTSLPPCPTTW